jgi:hypothetical protein
MKSRLLRWGVVWACLLASQATLAQVRFGTIAVVYYSEGKIAIAADSAGFLNASSPITSECKLAAIDGKLLFVTAGATAYRRLRPTADVVEPWDNIDEARKAYSFALAAGGDDLPLHTAKIWQQLITEKWQSLYRIHPKHVTDAVAVEHGGLTTAYFAGLGGTTRQLQLIKSHVSFDQSNEQPFSGTSAIASECLNTLCAMGTLDVAKEYILQTSDRARKEWAQWDDKTGPFAGPDGKVRVTMRLVDLTIAFHQGEDKVGPPIDAVELAADGTIRWVARKQQCPEN